MIPSSTYHIFNHANGRDDLFREEENYLYFLRKWKRLIDPVADTVAYCLMPNHFHFLVTVKNRKLLLKTILKRKSRKLNNLNLRGLGAESNLNDIDNFLTSIDDSLNLEGLNNLMSSYVIQQFSNLFNGYTKAINRRYNRYGSLFAPRFRRKQVQTNAYRLDLLAYIHCNPVLHGFERLPEKWQFSSYNELLLNGNWKRHFSVDFNCDEDYRAFHTLYLSEKMKGE